jgi:glucan phosphorylase
MVTSRTSSTTGAITSRADGLEKAGRRPYDIPVPGYGTNTVNLLHLWESRASEKFAFEAFNRGGYEEAVREKNHSETISKVLYPRAEKSFVWSSSIFSLPVRSRTSSVAFSDER